MTRILVAAALILVAVTLYSFFDCVVRDRAHIRVLPKWGWLLVILFVPVFGLLLWFLFGRSSFGQRRSRPAAPDDDPDYLQKIADEVEQAERRKRREELERRNRTGSTAASQQTEPQADTAEPDAKLTPQEQFERWLAEREQTEQSSGEEPTDSPESGENGANSANGR